MSEKLHAFIRHARAKGLDHGTIRTLLLSAGWKERDIASAIASEGLEMPVPAPPGAHGARDACLYLLTFASLYITLWSVVVLFYTYLDYLYPDPAWSDRDVEGALDVVRYAIAAIIIGFPLFSLLTVVLERAIPKDPDGQAHPVQKWLTYLTFFLAAAITVGDFITLLYFYLDGALTTRFVLKAVVLLVIAEIVLVYFAPARRVPAQPLLSTRLRHLVAGAGVVLVATAVVLGFTLAGSPETARLHRLDEKRIEDLRAIHQALQPMVTKRHENTKTVSMARALPKTLEEVAEFTRTKEAGHKLNLADPQTGEEYLYTVTSDKTYELSATFALVREKKQTMFWNHPKGKYTFKFNAESPP